MGKSWAQDTSLQGFRQRLCDRKHWHPEWQYRRKSRHTRDSAQIRLCSSRAQRNFRTCLGAQKNAGPLRQMDLGLEVLGDSWPHLQLWSLLKYLRKSLERVSRDEVTVQTNHVVLLQESTSDVQSDDKWSHESLWKVDRVLSCLAAENSWVFRVKAPLIQ